jgi:Na+/H+ antiporter NhaC
MENSPSKTKFMNAIQITGLIAGIFFFCVAIYFYTFTFGTDKKNGHQSDFERGGNQIVKFFFSSISFSLAIVGLSMTYEFHVGTIPSRVIELIAQAMFMVTIMTNLYLTYKKKEILT